MNIETTAEPIREGLPSLPKGKMLSGMDMESLHVLYTAGQMQDYARAALAARAAAPVSGQGASVADDEGLQVLLANYYLSDEDTEAIGIEREIFAYIDRIIDSRPRSEDSAQPEQAKPTDLQAAIRTTPLTPWR